MRITNQMMTNSMLSHINQNKVNMDTLGNQYHTGKKILKPSDDPIVAVRALKLRSNLTELAQYVDKNIPDAESWMDVTESAMKNVNTILTKINSYCVQGSTDTLTAQNREDILQNIVQLKEQIYQEGNSQYAGRYVFTGYKTDTPLIYTEAQNYGKNMNLTALSAVKNADDTYTVDLGTNMESVNSISFGGTKITSFENITAADFASITPEDGKAYYLTDTNQIVLGSNFTAIDGATDIAVEAVKYEGYSITESFSGEDIDLFKTVVTPDDYTVNKTYDAPQTVQASRIQLSYDNIYAQTMVDKNGVEYLESSIDSIKCTIKGVESNLPVTKTINSTDADAYQPGPDDIVVLADTGEIILGSNMAEKLKDASNIEITYKKTSFATSEMKPEHFFDCTFTNADGKITNYEQSSQDITYEVNFGQTLKVNTEAKDAITHDIDRLVDDLTTAVNNVAAIEKQIANIKDEMKNINLTPDEKAQKEAKLEQLDTSLALSKSIMQETFTHAISATQGFEDQVNVAVADLGSRSKRLELTKNRLEDQQVELEDLKSSNEDVDLVETVIRYKSAESVYTSSLSAAASVIKTSLLDFL